MYKRFVNIRGDILVITLRLVKDRMWTVFFCRISCQADSIQFIMYDCDHFGSSFDFLPFSVDEFDVFGAERAVLGR